MVARHYIIPRLQLVLYLSLSIALMLEPRRTITITALDKIEMK